MFAKSRSNKESFTGNIKKSRKDAKKKRHLFCAYFFFTTLREIFREKLQ